MIRLFVAVMLMTPLAADAATYSWTDAAGTVNFTDDLGAVPKKYRAKALQQAGSEETVQQPTPAVAELPPAKAGKIAAPVAPAVETKGVVPAGEKINSTTQYGDKTAEEWQAQFRGLRSELSSIEQKRDALKQEWGDGKKVLSRQQVADINVRNKQLNNEYEAVRLRLNALVDQANKVGLPPEFGQ